MEEEEKEEFAHFLLLTPPRGVCKEREAREAGDNGLVSKGFGNRGAAKSRARPGRERRRGPGALPAGTALGLRHRPWAAAAAGGGARPCPWARLRSAGSCCRRRWPRARRRRRCPPPAAEPRPPPAPPRSGTAAAAGTRRREAEGGPCCRRRPCQPEALRVQRTTMLTISAHKGTARSRQNSPQYPMITRRRSSWQASSGSTAAEPSPLPRELQACSWKPSWSKTATDKTASRTVGWPGRGGWRGETEREKAVLLLGKHGGESPPDQLCLRASSSSPAAEQCSWKRRQFIHDSISRCLFLNCICK
ncbi:uncharacterized protein [Melopsittacus undulatus]|uniref:uncharacterized protein n=1 Tax=Melopsittacus undulatus TaxID=13146 RepID=UPI00146F071C|nr:uncharacterized protein LOC117435912 [Melopsittacus undulatus]